MLFHKKCGAPLFLDLTKLLKATMTFGYSARGLTLGVGDLEIKEEIDSITFYCSSCGEFIEVPKGKNKEVLENIFGACINCGIPLPVESLYKPTHAGGIYCEKCGEPFKERGDTLTPVSKIIVKINFNR